MSVTLALGAEGGGGLAKPELGASYEPSAVTIPKISQPWRLSWDLNQAANGELVTTAVPLDANGRTALERNGFVVVPYPVPLTNMLEAYTFTLEKGVPVFVTSDSLLHLYHILFDDILKSIETNTFLPRLTVMTRALWEEALRQRETMPGDIREAATRNAAYFGVALALLGEPASVPADLLPVVEEELTSISNHSGFHRSPIFRYDEDYSQYVPRGHYTRSEALKRYFRAMMWFGRMTFLMKGGDLPGPAGDALVSKYEARIQTIQASLIALALDQMQTEGTRIADIWNRIYAVTAFFVGLADDLTPHEYKEALYKVFGSAMTAANLDDAAGLFALKQELATLRNPEINGGTGNCHIPPNATPEELDRLLAKTKGMRTMGQRFIPDSYLFQQLVMPITGEFTGRGAPFTMEHTYRGPQRCFPRGLDVLAALGSQAALDILDREGDTDYVGYDTSMNRLVAYFRSLSLAEWNRNLYWAWLYTLQSLLGVYGTEYPDFMQTAAWQCKQLNTALGSWTELRHDTILYAKQSYTPPVTSVPPEPDCGYAEPVPEFYGRLLAMTRMTRHGLGSLAVLDPVQETRLQVLEDILSRLLALSQKELEGIAFASEDVSYLRFGFAAAVGQLLQGISQEPDISTVLVADVHTDGNTKRVLEEGVGLAQCLVVAYRLPQGRIVMGAGPVFSYYEFKWAMADRLTDEQWAALLAAGTQPPLPEWTHAFRHPVTLPPADANTNRLPDNWEALFWPGTSTPPDPLTDADADGLTNLEENRAGTDPVDRTSCMRLTKMEYLGSALHLEWQAVSGRRYRILHSDDLRNWFLLQTSSTASDSRLSLTDTNLAPNGARFYRVRLVAQ